MVNDKFKVGDVVRIVHHANHDINPDEETDRMMSGCLDGLVVDALRWGSELRVRLRWLGHGRTAYVYTKDQKSGMQAHMCGDLSSSLHESCLEMVRKGPFWELPWKY